MTAGGRGDPGGRAACWVPDCSPLTAVRRSVEPSQQVLVGQVERLPYRSILLATAVMRLYALLAWLKRISYDPKG